MVAIRLNHFIILSALSSVTFAAPHSAQPLHYHNSVDVEPRGIGPLVKVGGKLLAKIINWGAAGITIAGAAADTTNQVKAALGNNQPVQVEVPEGTFSLPTDPVATSVPVPVQPPVDPLAAPLPPNFAPKQPAPAASLPASLPALAPAHPNLPPAAVPVASPQAPKLPSAPHVPIPKKVNVHARSSESCEAARKQVLADTYVANRKVELLGNSVNTTEDNEALTAITSALGPVFDLVDVLFLDNIANATVETYPTLGEEIQNKVNDAVQVLKGVALSLPGVQTFVDSIQGDLQSAADASSQAIVCN